jgi:pyruvate kinase
VDALLAAGVDVFRINSSHGTREHRRGMVERVRSRAARAGRIVGVLEDLAGPKIRIGSLADADGVELEVGARLRIAVGDFPGDAERVSTTCAPLAAAVRGGEPLLIDDGQILLRAISSDGAEIVAEVEHGGLLTARKGINVPGVELPLSAVTDADMEEIEAGVEMGVDFLGVSFVQSGDDLRKARAMTWAHGGDGVGLVAKIERPQALERLDDILSVSDAVMVARGDLGLEIPLERVPRVQKDITRRARDAGVPVIVATQVFDTMRHSPRPTRAEVSDAANAVDDGVDAIMLAGETAAGEYPVLAVQTLDAVLRDAESAQPDRVVPGDIGDRHDRALCDAAVTLAAAAGATAIVAVTGSGTTARQLAALRPPIPVYAFTADDDVARRLALYRSVAPLVAPADRLVVGQLKPELSRRGIVRAGDAVVIARVHSDLEVEDANFVELQRF